MNLALAWLVVLILVIFLRQYFHFDLLSKYPALKPIIIPIVIVIIMVTMIVSILVIYTNGSLEKKEYGWHVDCLNYKGLHKYSTGKSQRIALIDSGVSDFQMKINNKNSITLVSETQDNNGHGTMMYAILKGYEKEILGIAPDAEIISIKIANLDEKIYPALMLTAIEKAIKLDSTVISISIGSYLYNEEISNILDVALEHGITVVAASGDYYSADMLFPASKKGVVSVGSLSANARVSDFTNAPNNTIINAPGDEIKSIDHKKRIEFNSGTSQATAIISGYVALLRDYAFQQNIDLSNDNLIQLLEAINNKNISFLKAFSKIK